MDWKRHNFLLVYYLSALTPITYPTNFTDSKLPTLSDSSAIHYIKETHDQKQIHPPNSTSNQIKTRKPTHDIAIFHISNHANISHFTRKKTHIEKHKIQKVQKPRGILTIISSFFITRRVPEKKATTPDFSTPSSYYYYDKSEQEYTYVDDYIDDDFDSIMMITEINGTKREIGERMTKGQRMVYDLSYILGFMLTVLGIMCIAVQRMFKEDRGGFVDETGKGRDLGRRRTRGRMHFLVLDATVDNGGRTDSELNPKQVGQVGNLFGGRNVFQNDNDDDLIYV